MRERTADPQFWFLHAPTGAAWQVEEPALGCLAHAHDPLLAPARDRLLTLTRDDADRIVRLVVRRCGLHLLEVLSGRVVIHFWGQGGQADLRPFFKQHDLARHDVEVLAIDRKRELVTARPGTDFLYGEGAAPDFSWPLYGAKWEHRRLPEPDDRSGAPNSMTNFWWEGVEAYRLPWAVLKRAWVTEPSVVCPNCGLPLFVTGFWFVWSKCDVFWRHCFRCRQRFRDTSLFVLRWIVAYLDRDLWPTSHHQLRASTRKVLEQAAERAMPPEKPEL